MPKMQPTDANAAWQYDCGVKVRSLWLRLYLLDTLYPRSCSSHALSWGMKYYLLIALLILSGCSSIPNDDRYIKVIPESGKFELKSDALFFCLINHLGQTECWSTDVDAQ